MSRFFVKQENINGNIAKITGEDVKHISTVLRNKIGDTVILCDGKGKDYEGEFLSFSKNEINVKINKTFKNITEPNCKVTLYQALPKGDKSEIIIQKCVELGIFKIVFFISNRCISKPNDKSIVSKLERWNNISLSAAKQCDRGIIPKIEFNKNFSDVLIKAKQADLKVLFYEGEGTKPIKQILKSVKKPNDFSFIIGSEGGFEQDEVLLAKENGLEIGGLGKRILRTETAPICALSAFMYETDNL